MKFTTNVDRDVDMMLAKGAKELRYLNILSAIIVLYSSIIFSQVLLFNNKVYTLTNGYITEDQLKDIGFNIVKAERIYIIYNKKLIIGSSGDFIIDFEQYAQNAYTVSNGKLLVKIDSLIDVLKLQASNTILYDKPISINSISYTNDVIKIDTSAQLNKELLNISLLNNKLTIKLTPFDLPKNIPQGLNISKSNATLIISIPKDIEKYELSVTNQTIEIFLIPTSKKIDYIKRTETFAGRTFMVNYLILDPRFVDLVPVLPKNGIGHTAQLSSILSQNGLIHGINANYFDPATGMPIDIIISDGKVLSHRYGLRPMFIETTDDKVFIGKNYIDITVRIGEILLMVKSVNSKTVNEVSLYTDEYKIKIPKDISKNYIVVKNGKVTSVGYVEYVPSNSFVIAISNDIQKKYIPKISTGIDVSIELYTDNGYKIKNAVGAGPLLIQDKKIIQDSVEEKLRYGGGIPTTRASRTIIAIKDGKVHLITIEGTNGTGMNFDEAAQFLVSKGYESAMMLDGGGSTGMVYSGKIVTINSQRNISVALGVR